MGNAMKLAGVAGLAAVVAGGGCAAYAFSDTVKNQVKMRLDDPQEYFEWVCEKNIADMADCAGASWQRTADLAAQKKAVQYAVEFTPTDAVKSELNDSISDATSDFNEALRQIVANTDTIGFRTEGSLSGNGAAAALSLLVNGDSVLSSDVIMNIESDVFGVRIPELTTRWFTVDTAELDGASFLNEQNYIRFAMNPSDYVSAAEVSDFVTQIMTAAVAELPEPTLEKSVPVTVADMEADYTAFTLHITEDDAMRLDNALMSQLREDNMIRRLYVDQLGILSAEEYDEMLTKTAKHIDAYPGTDLTLYVDASGRILGTNAAAENGDKLFACAAADGTNVAFALSADETEHNVFSMNFRGTYDSVINGTLDATVCEKHYQFDSDADDYTYEYETQSLRADFSNVEITDKVLGLANGTIQVTIPEIDPFTVSLSNNGSTQEISTTVCDDGTAYGDLKISFGYNDSQLSTDPDLSDAVRFSKDNGKKLSDYVQKDAFITFMRNLLVKLGVERELAEKLTASSANAVYFDREAFFEETERLAQERTEKAKADYEKEVSALEEEADARYAENLEKLEEISNANQQKLDDFKAESDAALKAARENNQSEFDRMKQDIEAAAQEARDEFNQEAAETKEQIQQGSEEIEKQMKEIQEELKKLN